MSRLGLRLHPANDSICEISPPSEEGYVVGRSDESSDYLPDIDLANYNARALGVSRRHAALVRYHGIPHVIDLSSVNGTFLNGRRLVPEVPYPIENDCVIRLGTLQLSVTVSSDKS